jgi:hypothetical protein
MNKNKILPQFIVRIAVKNESGAVVGEREFITYAGLLAVAHEIGLDEVNTTILQMPTEANGQTAVVRAIAKGKPGLFTGLGDASPANVNRKVQRHLLRVAETRAKARALRDLCNIHIVALEELGGDDDLDADPAVAPGHAHSAGARDDRRVIEISDAQKRALWRKALQLGYEGRAAHAFLRERLGVEPERATREGASRLLDALAREEREQRMNGGDHAAE